MVYMHQVHIYYVLLYYNICCGAAHAIAAIVYIGAEFRFLQILLA